jgi:hypothetical protein
MLPFKIGETLKFSLNKEYESFESDNKESMREIALKEGYLLQEYSSKPLDSSNWKDSFQKNKEFFEKIEQTVLNLFGVNSCWLFRKFAESTRDCHYVFDFRYMKNIESLEIPDFCKESSFGIFCVRSDISGFVFAPEMSDATTKNKYFGSLIKMIEEFTKKNKAKKKITKGDFNMLISNGHQLYFQKVGVVKNKLIESNYSESVVKDHLSVIEEFHKKNPFGRLAVYNGPAGTGKTNLVENIISSFDNKHFKVALIPSDIVAKLAEPSYIPSLLQSVSLNQSLVFILEDADDLLVQRSDGKKSGPLSTLLNFCDGTIGRRLNIRVVATTNLSFDSEDSEFKHKIDPAANRPGRMFKKIHVGKLTAKEASIAISRIAGNEIKVENKMTLAECYEHAHKLGIK